MKTDSIFWALIGTLLAASSLPAEEWMEEGVNINDGPRFQFHEVDAPVFTTATSGPLVPYQTEMVPLQDPQEGDFVSFPWRPHQRINARIDQMQGTELILSFPSQNGQGQPIVQSVRVAANTIAGPLINAQTKDPLNSSNPELKRLNWGDGVLIAQQNRQGHLTLLDHQKVVAINQQDKQNALPSRVAELFGREECEALSFDHRARFGADSYQGSSSLCWAHVAAALAEEQMAKHNPQLVPPIPTLSRTFMTTLTSTPIYHALNESFMDTTLQAHTLHDILNTLFQKASPAVCLDTQAPDLPSRQESERSLAKLLKSYQEIALASRCHQDKLFELLRPLQPLLVELRLKTADSPLTLESAQQLVSDMGPKSQRWVSEDQFAKRILLTMCPQDQRLSLATPPLGTKAVVYAQDDEVMESARTGNVQNSRSLKSAKAELLAAKHDDASPFIRLCFNPLHDAFNGRAFAPDRDCNPHFMVISAIRWHVGGPNGPGRCEAFMKNSHGPAGISGFIPIETLLHQGTDLGHLAPR